MRMRQHHEVGISIYIMQILHQSNPLHSMDELHPHSVDAGAGEESSYLSKACKNEATCVTYT